MGGHQRPVTAIARPCSLTGSRGHGPDACRPCRRHDLYLRAPAVPQQPCPEPAPPIARGISATSFATFGRMRAARLTPEKNIDTVVDSAGLRADQYMQAKPGHGSENMPLTDLHRDGAHLTNIMPTGLSGSVDVQHAMRSSVTRPAQTRHDHTGGNNRKHAEPQTYRWAHGKPGETKRNDGKYCQRCAHAPHNHWLCAGQPDGKRCRSGRSRRAHTRRSTSVPLVPPKPKEFFMATSIVIARALLAQ